jgi:hypothetical protein
MPGNVPIPTDARPPSVVVPGTGVAGSKTGIAAKKSPVKAERSKTTVARSRGYYAGRDPFWPVGFKPKKEVVVAHTNGTRIVKSEWEQAEEIIQSKKSGTATGKDGHLRVLINAQVARVGQNVKLDFKRQTYIWRVKSINVGKKGKITLDLERLGVR